MDYLKLTKGAQAAFYQAIGFGGRSFVAVYWNQGPLGKEVTKGK